MKKEDSTYQQRRVCQASRWRGLKFVRPADFNGERSIWLTVGAQVRGSPNHSNKLHFCCNFAWAALACRVLTVLLESLLACGGLLGAKLATSPDVAMRGW